MKCKTMYFFILVGLLSTAISCDPNIVGKCYENDECVDDYLCDDNNKCVKVDQKNMDISIKELDDSVVGKQYSFSLSVHGGLPPYSWNIVTGPEWLKTEKNEKTGNWRLTGVPQIYQNEGVLVKIEVTDSSIGDGQKESRGDLSIRSLYCLESEEPTAACSGHGTCEGDGVCSCVVSHAGSQCKLCNATEGYELNSNQECVRYEYQCASSDCGADVQRRSCIDQSCNNWETLTDCSDNQICLVSSELHECRTCDFNCENGTCMGCGSGACCNTEGNIKPVTEICNTGANYRCVGSACGADIEKQSWHKYCNGQTPGCDGDTINDNWELHIDCDINSLCVEGTQTCSECTPGCDNALEIGACFDCDNGACCETTGYFKNKGAVCEEWYEHQCAADTCDPPQIRTVQKKCTGNSATCDGTPAASSWYSGDACEADEMCVFDGTNTECTPCGENSSCTGGGCTCDFQPCGDVCCNTPDEVCRWSEQCGIGNLKLSALDAASGDNFGASVFVDGDVAIIGAPGKDEGGYYNTGAAYIFRKTSSGWTQEAKLTATQGGSDDNFGWSVSISGDSAIVGALSHDHDGTIDTGAAYIFKKTTTGWQLNTKLVADSGTRKAEDYFGVSVSISGDVAIVGSYYSDDGSIEDCGAAYIFKKGSTNWYQAQRLVASDKEANDKFGKSVSISGSAAIIGAPSKTGDGSLVYPAGIAYIFENGTSGWAPKNKIFPPMPRSDYEHFGKSVSIDGDVAIVGSLCINGMYLGTAHIFRRSSNGLWWGREDSFDAPLPYFSDYLAISGDLATFGTPSDEDMGYHPDGAVVIYRKTGSGYDVEWKLEAGIEPSDIGASDIDYTDKFGSSVSINGDVIFVGAPKEDGDDDLKPDSGAVYVL